MGSTTSSSISISSRSMGTFIADAITTNLFFQGDQAEHCDLGQGVQRTACDPWVRRVHQGHHRRLWEVSTMYRLRQLSKAASSITSDCIPNMISDCQRWIIEPVWFDICPMPLSQLSLWSGIKQSRRSWILKLPGVEATARELRRTTSPNLLVEIPTSGGLVSAQPMDRGRLGLVKICELFIFLKIARFSIGDYQDHFSIQSTSKPFTYALALNHMGAEVRCWGLANHMYMYDLTLALLSFTKDHQGQTTFRFTHFCSGLFQ